ncbi:uncharacterized protein FOMMEDRAFT_153498 [Fomitiporia mediterranea MF3/22]|uniref:uncharacterized protein n=1 Tax=Fomitiporia mediterranea (strain MF3/22) TaxID=694068 RepID=UPI0004407B0D|nr:uncharacterized protein FOMMEDRAFT_153498 [Fomitiporia mediterranea MF3/22]EJD06121.1 hypothetical protein FOMMEDRAFT_153498 [Fomitiporia mediterranea MF3/22]
MFDYGYTVTFHVRSNPEYVDPSLVPLFVSEVVNQNYSYLAMLTVLVYHALTNMDKEVRYFWNRYIGLLGQICNIIVESFNESLLTSVQTFIINSQY